MLDDPAVKARTVRLLVLLTVPLFVLCYVLAWLQGAEVRHSLLIAAVGAAMSLGAAAAIHLMGSKSWIALVVVKAALALVARR